MLYSEIDISSIENKILTTNKNESASSKFFNEIKNKCKINNKVLLQLFESFLKTKISENKFLILGAMLDVVSEIYLKMDPQVKVELRKMIYHFILNRDLMLSITNEKYLMVKFSNFFVLWLFIDYPENMQNIFDDLNELIIKTNKLSEQIQLVKLYIKILLAINDYFILDCFDPGNGYYILNFMRSNDTKRFIFILKGVFLNYSQFDYCNINDAILVVSQLMQWNPFSSLEEISCYITTKLIFIKEHRFYSLCVVKNILKKLPEEGDVTYYNFLFDTIYKLLASKDNEEKEFYVLAKILNIIGITIIQYNILNIELANNPYKSFIPSLILLFEEVIKSKFYKAINKLFDSINLLLKFYFLRKTDETYGLYCNMIKSLLEFLSENEIDAGVEYDYCFNECKNRFKGFMTAHAKNTQFRKILLKQIFKLDSQKNKEHMLHNILYILSLIPKFNDQKRLEPDMQKAVQMLLSDTFPLNGNPTIKNRYISTLSTYFENNNLSHEATQLKVMNSIIGENGIICRDLCNGHLYTSAFNALINDSVKSIKKTVLEKINDNICELVKSLILLEDGELLIQYHFIFKTSALSISWLDTDKQCLYVNLMINTLLTIFDIYNDHNNAFIIMTQCLDFFFSRLTREKGNMKLADLIYTFFDSYIKNRYSNTALDNIKDVKTLFNVTRKIFSLASEKIIEIVNILLAHEHNRLLKEEYIFYANFFADFINALKNKTFKAIRLYFPSFYKIAKSLKTQTSNISDIDERDVMALNAYSNIVNEISSCKTLNGFNEVGVADIIRFEMLLCDNIGNNQTVRIKSIAQICNVIVHRGLKKIINEIMIELLNCLFEIWRKNHSLFELIVNVHLAFAYYEDRSLYDNYLKGLFIPSLQREYFFEALDENKKNVGQNLSNSDWISIIMNSYFNKMFIH